jgi:hypothetical protein
MKTLAHIEAQIRAQPGYDQPGKIDLLVDQIVAILKADPAIAHEDWCGGPNNTVRVIRQLCPFDAPPDLPMPLITVATENSQPAWLFDGSREVALIYIDLFHAAAPAQVTNGLALGEFSDASVAAYVRRVALINGDGNPRQFVIGTPPNHRPLIHVSPVMSEIIFDSADGKLSTPERLVRIGLTFTLSQGAFAEY